MVPLRRCVSLEPVANFLVPRDVGDVVIAGWAESPSGERFPFRIPALELPNTPPRFVNPRIVSMEAFDVVIAASATDFEGDSVTISVDWGMEQPAVGSKLSLLTATPMRVFKHTKFACAPPTAADCFQSMFSR